MNRRSFGKAALASLALPLLGTVAPAFAKLRNGPIRVFIGFPPGGATDVVARIVVERLSKALDDQVFVVENRAGAGGQIAAQALKASPPDGSTIMLSIDHTQVIIPLTITGANYDAVNDFTALAGVAQYYNVLAVRASTGVTTMAELQAWLKQHPAEANFGIPAAGSVPQFIGHIVGQSAGVTMNAIPYKGGAPMVQDLLGGQIPIAIASMTELIEHHRSGKVRILASSGEARSRSAPDIPTFKELGLSGIEQNPWLAFVGPKGLPKAFVDAFDQAIKTVLGQPDVQERLTKMGNEVSPVPASEVDTWIVSGSRHWGKVISDSGYKPQ